MVSKCDPSLRLVFRSEGPERVFLARPYLPLDLETPVLLFVRAKPELAEGDAHLHVPSLGRDAGPHLPDRIPGSIAAGEGVIGARSDVAYRS